MFLDTTSSRERKDEMEAEQDPILASPLLRLPYELRQLVYEHAFPKEYIIIPHPQPCRFPEHKPRPVQNVFYHPDPNNLHVFGINGTQLQWTVRHVPSLEFMSMRFDYDAPQRSSPDYAWPLGATCRTLHEEVRRFIFGSRASFAFSDFQSLIVWLKRTDAELLKLVRTVKLEVHLRIDEPEETVESSMDDEVDEDRLAAGWDDPACCVNEADEPWFDALKMARERLPALRAFSMVVELCGPPLAPSVNWGPSGRPTGRMAPELKAAFRKAAGRVIAEARAFVPEVDDGGRQWLAMRHVSIMAVQRHPSIMQGINYQCRGREVYLGKAIMDELASMEMLPEWQRSLIDVYVPDLLNSLQGSDSMQ